MRQGVHTLEDMIRQEMVVRGSRRMHIILRTDGRYEAAFMHRDGRTGTCDVSDDPADALWNTMVDSSRRRRLPSGREAVIVGAVAGLDDDLDLLEDLSPSNDDLDLLVDIDLSADEELDLLA